MRAEELEHGEDVAGGLARMCAEQAADMIVIAAKRASGLSELILGSAAQALLKQAPCPVLVVPATR